ncbi:MAG: HNH endonuclease signature motif containing protein, partial [Nocardioidaceae bacterium]
HILDQIRNTIRPDDADNDTTTARDERNLRLRPVGSGLAAIDGLLSGEDGERLDQRLDQIVGWLRTLGDERGTGVLRAVAMGHLTEPDSLHLLHDQATRTRARNGGTEDTATGDENDDENGEGDEGGEASADATVTSDAFQRGGGHRRLPQTVVYLHLDRTSGTWSMDGTGPISRAEARDIIGHTHVTLKPVIDLAANLTYTGYLAPPRLKEQTALQNAGLCTFPSCNRPARTADYDHLVDYADGGATSSRNGHRLCRYHHRCKTFTHWQVQSPAPGTWLWTSPDRRTYLVTAGTTTRIDRHQQHRRTSAA